MHVGANYTTEEAIVVPERKMYKYMYLKAGKPSVIMILQPDGYYRGNDDMTLYLSDSADHVIAVDYDIRDKTVPAYKYLISALTMLSKSIDAYEEGKVKSKKPGPPKKSKGK